MTRSALPRHTIANLTSALALVVAVGGGGAYAATLAKNSVGSAQVKNGALKAMDVKAGALTGAQVKDGALAGNDIADDSLTGDDVKESTLRLPATARVVEGPVTWNTTLANTWKTYATVTFTAPAAGYARIDAEATLAAGAGAAPGGYVDALFNIDDDGVAPYGAVGSYTLWGSPDPSGDNIDHMTASDVVAVEAGTYVVTLELREHLTSGFSSLINGQIDVQFFPEGSAQTS
jgi:hypothetical protein